MSDRVTGDDVGKPVVHDGEQVGEVVDYQNETAFVDPTPGLGETVAAKLGLEEGGATARPLEPALVESVTDEVVRLKTEL